MHSNIKTMLLEFVLITWNEQELKDSILTDYLKMLALEVLNPAIHNPDYKVPKYTALLTMDTPSFLWK